MSPPLCSVFTSLVAVWTKPKCPNVESCNRRAMDHAKSNCQVRVNSGSKNCITKVPVRFHSFYSSGNDKCWRGCGEIGTLLCCCQECKTMQLLWKTFWSFLIRLNLELPFTQHKSQQMENNPTSVALMNGQAKLLCPHSRMTKEVQTHPILEWTFKTKEMKKLSPEKKNHIWNDFAKISKKKNKKS